MCRDLIAPSAFRRLLISVYSHIRYDPYLYCSVVRIRLELWVCTVKMMGRRQYVPYIGIYSDCRQETTFRKDGCLWTRAVPGNAVGLAQELWYWHDICLGRNHFQGGVWKETAFWCLLENKKNFHWDLMGGCRPWGISQWYRIKSVA